MKVRHGFVSNSSSSSFIIGINREETAKCECCGRGGEDILEMLEGFNDDLGETEVEWVYPGDRIATLEFELERYGECEYVSEEIALIKANQEKFTRMLGISIGYGDSLSQHIFDQLVEAGDITVIWGDH